MKELVESRGGIECGYGVSVGVSMERQSRLLVRVGAVDVLRKLLMLKVRGRIEGRGLVVQDGVAAAAIELQEFGVSR